MDNQRYFYISGIISFSLFLFFVAMFVLMLFQVQDIKKYGFKKEKYVSVSIDFTPLPSTKPAVKSTHSPIVQKQVVTKTKNIDVQNLFSDVWTQKIDNSVVRKKINSKRISEIQKQIKFKSDKKVTPIDNKLDKNVLTPSKKETKATSTANEVNEYLAKIQSIVYQHFNVPLNSQGNSVKTLIELDPFGKMLDFRILRYSSNDELNSEADKIKERLQNVVFPQNPEHKSSKTVVILISKE